MPKLKFIRKFVRGLKGDCHLFDFFKKKKPASVPLSAGLRAGKKIEEKKAEKKEVKKEEKEEKKPLKKGELVKPEVKKPKKKIFRRGRFLNWRKWTRNIVWLKKTTPFWIWAARPVRG